MEIKIRVPALSGLVPNLLGLLGLLGFALAVGGLTGNWWWSLLCGSVFTVGLAYVAQTYAAASQAARVAAAAPARPSVVADAS